MSVPVWRDILEDLGRQSWATLEPAEAPIPAWCCHGAECDAVLAAPACCPGGSRLGSLPTRSEHSKPIPRSSE